MGENFRLNYVVIMNSGIRLAHKRVHVLSMCWLQDRVLFHQASLNARCSDASTNSITGFEMWIYLNSQFPSSKWGHWSCLPQSTTMCGNQGNRQSLLGLLLLSLKVQLPPNFIQWIITKQLSYDRNYASNTKSKRTSLLLWAQNLVLKLTPPNKESTDTFLESTHLAYHSLLKNH